MTQMAPGLPAEQLVAVATNSVTVDTTQGEEDPDVFVKCACYRLRPLNS